jgi:hypothetical protein
VQVFRLHDRFGSCHGSAPTARSGWVAVLAAAQREDGWVDRGLKAQVVGALADEADDVLGVGGPGDDLDTVAERADLGAREGTLARRVGQRAQLALQQQRQLGDAARGLAVAVRVVEREVALHLPDLDGEVDGEIGQLAAEGLGDGARRIRAALGEDLDPDERGARVDHRLHVAAVAGAHGQAGEDLAGLTPGIEDPEVEGLPGGRGVVVDGHPQAVAPDTGLLGVHGQCLALAATLGGVERDACLLAGPRRGHPHDHRGRAAVAEELVDGVADRAPRAQAAEAAFEVGEAGDPHRMA